MISTTGVSSGRRQRKIELTAATIPQAVQVLLVADNFSEAEAVHSLLVRPEYGAFVVTHVPTLG